MKLRVFTTFAACFLSISVLIIPSEVSAEEAVLKTRPKIGVALAGGGAKGAAHVGALRELEKLNIPIDYIAGTSMGAIVAGFYAAGYSPDEMEAILKEIDWELAFKDVPPRQKLSFRRKQDDDNFLTKFKFGVGKGGIQVPKGFIQGQNLNAMLTSYTMPVADIQDFDKLRIPYRAVAADIETGEEVVIGKGNLASAIRASMSVPGAFAPVVIDERTLVDGGIVNNLPISVVRDMGADIVIAVDVGTPLKKADELNSAFAISGQVISILLSQTTERSIKTLTEKDVLIVCDLEGIGAADFGQVEEAVRRGDKALTEENIKDLKKLSVPPDQFAMFIESQRASAFDPPKIDSIVVNSDSKYSDEDLKKLVHSEVGQPLDQDQMLADYERIVGLDIFDKVDVGVVEKDGENQLTYKVREKEWGPHYLRMGLNIENDLKGDSIFNMLFSVTSVPMNASGAEWRNEFQIGDEMRLYSEWYQTFGGLSQYFIAPSIEWNRKQINIVSENLPFTLANRSYWEGTLDIGRVLGNWGEIRAGLVGSHIRVKPEAQLEEYESTDFVNVNYRILWRTDTLDNRHFPREGFVSRVEWDAAIEDWGAEIPFQRLGMDVSGFNSWGRHTLGAGINYGTSFDDSSPIDGQWRLGGFLNLSGYRKDVLGGRNAGRALLVYYYQFGKPASNPLSVTPYARFSLETGSVWEEREDLGFDDLIMAGSVWAGLDTAIGPFYFAYGLNENESSFYLYLGQTF